MLNQRVWKFGSLCGAAGLFSVGMVLPAHAANLLANPGFESPNPGTPTFCNSWPFIGTGQRQTFQNHTPGPNSTWCVWNRTFEPAGGGTNQTVGITGGANYTFSAFMYAEANYPTSAATSQLSLTWLDSNNQPVGSASTLNIAPASVTLLDQWAPYSFGAVAPATATQVRAFLGWTGGSPGLQSIATFWDDVVLDGPGTPPQSTWSVNGSGDWNTADNWANLIVPNGTGTSAEFFGAISTAQTVFTNTATTVGTMSFNNANTYVISGAGSITLQAPAGSANLIVQQGTHKINLPLIIATNTNANVSAGATLQLADPTTLNSGTTLSKNGPGTMTVLSTLNATGPAIIKVNAGVLNLATANNNPNISVNVDPATLNVGANQTLGVMTLSLGGNVVNVGRDPSGANVPARLNVSALHVTGPGSPDVVNNTLVGNSMVVAGSVTIVPGAKLSKQGAGVLKAASLSITGTGQLDMTSSHAVVDYTGGTTRAAVVSLLQSGYASGAWNGNGINSSNAAATAASSTRTAVGIAEATDLFSTFPASFQGESIDNTSLVITYTLAGDASLDRAVNGADFNLLASNFGTTGQYWYKGDFTYDGSVNGADFNVLASNFGKNLPGGPGAAVPEPMSLGMLAIGAAALLTRRAGRRGR